MRKITLILFLCCICGCNSTPDERILLELSNPEPITMLDYNITVFTVNDEAKICVSGEGYENMSKNMMELKRYIIQQNEIIKSYKNYYEKRK